MLLFGGSGDSGRYGDTWVYDLSTNTWTEMALVSSRSEAEWTAVSPSARGYHALAPLGEGQVLLFGGHGGDTFGDTWVYDLSANTWTDMAPKGSPSARGYHALAPLGEGQVLLFGGHGGDACGDTWVYDLSANTWTNMVSPAAPSARVEHALASLGGDQALLFGGYNGRFYGDTWVYDLSAGTWTEMALVSSRSEAEWTPTAPSARMAHALAPLGGDQALLFGGYNGRFYGDTWVYDLSAGTWTEMAPPTAPSARVDHALAPLGKGKVLLFGGYDGSYLGDTWVYDLSANTWTDMALVSSRSEAEWTPAAPSARWGHALAPLGEGQVLLFGGCHGHYFGDTWVYDLSANTWTNMVSLRAPSARVVHALAPLGGDQVLLFGGNGGDTWVYDLSANTWTEMAPPVSPSARGYHALAPLGEGQVLLFGGSGGSYLGDTWLAAGFYRDYPSDLPPVAR